MGSHTFNIGMTLNHPSLPSRRGSTSESSVAQRIRELIVSGSLKPGARVAEAAIAERLGVSRTPVRNVIPADALGNGHVGHGRAIAGRAGTGRMNLGSHL